MLTRRKSMAVLALALGLVLAGCSSGDGAADPGGVWGSEADGQARLELGDDGSLTGNDGCNQLAGEWEQDGDTVTFNDVAMTLMACEDVDTWMTGLATATVSGDTMTVLDQAGDELGTLERNPNS